MLGEAGVTSRVTYNKGAIALGGLRQTFAGLGGRRLGRGVKPDGASPP
jgi:hypothetical protein